MFYNVNFLNKNECTGCKVCYQVCPHDAITIIENKKGLNHPIIDDNKCTNCSICVKKCHALNDNFETEFEQQIYDVRASDDIRIKSSSGGMFTLVANYVLENNGYVCGASFRNDWLGVEHIIINDKKYLDKLRGSKYIESDLGNCFSEIKKLLNENNLVLFTGCPCQVSALKSYLNKDYNNLIIIDLICNSIVPNNIWVKYLKEQFTEKEIKNIEYISFRDKKKIGWDGRLYIKLKEREYIDEIYKKLFSEHIATKEECYNCQYRRYERVSDITIGDNWDEENNDNKGVSLVLVNTEKGNNVFNKIKNNCIYKSIDKKFINAGINLNYTSDKREYFFDNIDNDTLENLYKKANKFDIGFIGFWFAPNYGAILTNYALYKVLKNLGFSILMIDLIENDTPNKKEFDKGIARDFALRYYDNIKLINDNNTKDICDKFITASDQLWNLELIERYGMISELKKMLYFLNFVDNSKKKIAIATSYGDDHHNLDNKSNYNRMFIKYYLSQFDNISLREPSSAKFIQDNFDIDAYGLIDPVFLADKEEYDKLIEKHYNNLTDKKEENNYIFGYLYNAEYYLDDCKYISNKLNKEFIFTKFNEQAEEWLYLLKNSSFVITDSFHGSCFAIIFNKPFICIKKDFYTSKLLRIRDLFTLLNIEDRLIQNIEILKDNLDEYLKLDYTYINQKLESEKKRCLEWIKNALYSPKVIKKDFHKDDIINILIKENNDLKQQINNMIDKIDSIDRYLKIEINNMKYEKKLVNLFGIYNSKNYIYIYFFGIKGSIKVTEKNINRIAWWLPVKEWRDNFRSKFAITDQTRPDQTRPDQTRPDQTRPDQTRNNNM